MGLKSPKGETGAPFQIEGVYRFNDPSDGDNLNLYSLTTANDNGATHQQLASIMRRSPDLFFLPLKKREYNDR